MLVPIVLLAALLIIVFSANSMKKKGKMTESSYQTLISAASIVVTIGAVIALIMRMRG